MRTSGRPASSARATHLHLGGGRWLGENGVRAAVENGAFDCLEKPADQAG
jgi:hypothetical protein